MRKNQICYLIVLGLVVLTAARFESLKALPANEAGNSKIAASFEPTFALQGTALLTSPIPEDIREKQRQQIIHYFESRIAATPAQRDALWRPDFSSHSAYQSSLQLHRTHLGEMLGLGEMRIGAPHINVLAENAGIRIEDVILPLDSGLTARALVFLPKSAKPAGSVIVIPPAHESREEFAGVAEGAKPAAWLASLLARDITVAVPITIERREDHLICEQAGGKDRRRVLWRAGFIVGRTLVGLEVQQALALRQYLASLQGAAAKPIAIMGEGQGGMTALYAGALDEHFAAVASLDYFQQRENCWQEPVDRVINGQLKEFGDAEVAALIAPRPLFVGASSDSILPSASVNAEFSRAQRFYKGLKVADNLVALPAQPGLLNAAAVKMADKMGANRNTDSPEVALQVPPERSTRPATSNLSPGSPTCKSSSRPARMCARITGNSIPHQRQIVRGRRKSSVRN